MKINFELNIDKSIQKKMQLPCEQMTKNVDDFEPVIFGLLDDFITAAKKHIPNDVIILQQKEYEKLRAEVEKCNREFTSFPEKSLSELFGSVILSKEYPKATPKTPDEIIQSKKNKQPFYKSLDRLKKWEK